MDISNTAVAKGLATVNESKHLTDREKALIGLAVTTTRGCIKCSGSRIKKALAAGIPFETIMAGVDLAAMVNAGVTLSMAVQGMEKEGIDQVCNDATCSTGAANLATAEASTKVEKVLQKSSK